MKVVTRNNLLRKLSSTIRTTSLALSYYVAEYAAPVWARSAHAYKLDSELNSVCRTITGCLTWSNLVAVTDWGGSNSRFLGLVSVSAARSLDQTALRPSVIKRIRQMTLNTQHTCKVYLRKNGNVHKMKKEETCKNNMVSSKNETVVLRMIYKSTLKCSNDSSRLSPHSFHRYRKANNNNTMSQTN